MSFPESSPQVTRWCALLVAIVMSISTTRVIVSVIHAERTGVAYYSPNPGYPAIERVTRAESPGKFHDAVTVNECRIFFYGGIAAIAFYFFRRLSD